MSARHAPLRCPNPKCRFPFTLCGRVFRCFICGADVDTFVGAATVVVSLFTVVLITGGYA